MKKLSLILLFLLGCALVGFTQEDGLTLLNSKSIDESRYDDIRNDPYYFNEWVIANIITNSGNVIKEVPLNFNGYSKEFEIKKGERFIELDTRGLKRIEVPVALNSGKIKGSSESMIVFRPMHPTRFSNNFGIFIYEGAKLELVQEFRIVIDSKTINDVGKIREFKAFAKKSNYYLFSGEEHQLIKLKKKPLLKSLEHPKELEAFMKKHKTDLNAHDDLRALFEYYERLIN